MIFHIFRAVFAYIFHIIRTQKGEKFHIFLIFPRKLNRKDCKISFILFISEIIP